MNETNASESGSAGNFDPERAVQLRSQAQEAFVARHRLAARLTWVYLLGCLLAGWWCVHKFLAVDDLRSWILWSVLFLIAFETTVLMKLWYWVVNSKLSVLRELKLLRMDLAVQKGAHAALEQLTRVESPTNVPGIAKWERYAWMTAMIVIGALIGVEVSHQGDRYYQARGQMTSDTQVTLTEDGTGVVQASYTLANSTGRTLERFTIYSGGSIDKAQRIPSAESSWTDGLGRKLDVLREPDPNGPNRRDVIELREPVPPGQHFTLSTTYTMNARGEDGTWVFSHDQNWGYRQNFYRASVALPPGAELVSAAPAPARLEKQTDKTILHFAGERSSGKKWSYVVQYRLPEK